MARQRHLANAPITEAVVDFRTVLPPTFELDRFSEVEAEVREKYPIREELRVAEFSFGIRDDKSFAQPSPDRTRGILLKSGDKKRIAQFRRDGFTFNQLGPYPSWKTIFSEAESLWRLYVKVASPIGIPRIALRYINHIKLLHEQRDLSDYLAAPPTMPRGLQGDVSGFLGRLLVSGLGPAIQASITQAVSGSLLGQDLPAIVLDIDVFKKYDKLSSTDQLAADFKVLHDVKNMVFFASITEATARRYE